MKKIKENTNGQQGDVLLERISQIPIGATLKKKDKRGVVLAEGEHTGHYHAIVSDGAELFEKDGTLYLKCEKESVLKHQEHEEILVMPGSYKIGIVQEYDYIKQMIRPVAD